MRGSWVMTIVALLGFASVAPLRAHAAELRACIAERNAPPFSYTYTEQGVERTGGFAWRVLAEILPAGQWQLQIQTLPWARCLGEIGEGRQDLAVNATWNEERARTYRLSQPYFLSHVHFFWSREQFAQPPVASVADLQNLRVCGVLGHNYAALGLRAEQIDTGSRTFDSVFEKLAGGRCQVFAQSIEDIEGEQAAGATWLSDPRIAHEVLPGMDPVRRCFLLSRDPRTAGLVAAIDAGLARLRASGRLDALLAEENALLRERFAAARH